jgi:phosphatidylserine/phosphatidylglycerophosphate/cardiolipin synthase-like enzyme
MRDGSVLAGNIVGETSDAYRTLIQTPSAPMMTNVPVRAVRYVVYGSSQKARSNLDLDRVARALNARDIATVRFLPTEAFGEAVQEAVQSARSRIWILAYFISGGSHPTIQTIYNMVREKARTGLDSQVISEFSKGTLMPIRNASLNYANTLQDDGVTVRFVQEYRAMHKKVILVDHNKVLLGSANLTGYGVGNSDEFSVLIQSEPFTGRVEADIRRIRQISKTIRQLEF